MALQPVGSLPASTYWRRRVLLLVVAVALVLLGTRACGGSPAPSPRAATGSAHPTATATPTAAAARPPVARTSPPSAPAVPAVPAVPATCRDAVLQVTAQSDADTYATGAAPRFTLTVRNIGSAPCRRALGPGAVELLVFSGEDRIWSSDDCNESKDQGVLTLPAGAAKASTVQWSGKRTKPGCQVGAAAQPGTYRVSARIGTIVRQGSVFRVTG